MHFSTIAKRFSLQEVELVKEAYFNEFRRNLEGDLLSETKGEFARLLISMVNADRDESTKKVDHKLAEQDAAKLHAVGEIRRAFICKCPGRKIIV